MPYLFLAGLGFILFLLLLQKLEHAEVRLLVKTLKWTFVSLMVLTALYLTLVGRLLHVAAIGVLLILLLKKDMHQWIKEKRHPLSLPRSLTEEEAAALLKVRLNARPQEIKKAFKEIKAKDSTHHDRLQQARDILLKRNTK